MNLKLTELQFAVLKSIQAGWKLYLTSGAGSFVSREGGLPVNRVFTLKKGIGEYPVHRSTGNSLYDRGLIKGTHYLTLTEMGKKALTKATQAQSTKSSKA